MPAVFKRKRRTIIRKRLFPKKKIATKAYVRKAIVGRMEKKYTVTNQGSVSNTVPATGQVYDLITLSRGTGDRERVGDTVQPFYVHIKGNMAASDSHNTVRLILFIWKPQSTPIVGSILDATGGDAWNHLVSYNMDTRNEYKILYDRLHCLNANGQLAKTFKINVRLKGKPYMRFNGSSTSIATNKVYLLAISDSTVASHPAFWFYSKFIYTDS